MTSVTPTPQARAQNWARTYYTYALYAYINLFVLTAGMEISVLPQLFGPVLVLLAGEVRHARQGPGPCAGLPAPSHS